MGFEIVEHTADVALRLTAPDLSGLLQAATDGLRSVLIDVPASRPVEEREARAIDLAGLDPESLLVDYLCELIFLFDCERLLTVRLEPVPLDGAGPCRLVTRVLGETLDPSRHVALTEVKAATYHGLEVRPSPRGLQATVVLDL